MPSRTHQTTCASPAPLRSHTHYLRPQRQVTWGQSTGHWLYHAIPTRPLLSGLPTLRGGAFLKKLGASFSRGPPPLGVGVGGTPAAASRASRKKAFSQFSNTNHTPLRSLSCPQSSMQHSKTWTEIETKLLGSCGSTWTSTSHLQIPKD